MTSNATNDTGDTGMSTPRPTWKTVRAEDVRRLLPREEWGLWQEGFTCFSTTPIGEVPAGAHPSEPPFFHHCLAHMEGIRRWCKPPAPWPPRDQGLCISCGESAEKRTGPDSPSLPVACVIAEREGMTIARLTTKSYCRSCNPHNPENFPRCRGTVCQETGEERRVQRRGCCGITRTSRRRHCAVCCAAAAASLSVQVMPADTREKGAAARRKQGAARREQIGELHREGLDNKAIAVQLGVHVRTVQRALGGADDVATDQR